MKERKPKKRSEKLSDSAAARMARESGSARRLDAIAGDARSNASGRNKERNELASMQTRVRHSFTRCPHCREFVPIRDACRACGTPMT